MKTTLLKQTCFLIAVSALCLTSCKDASSEAKLYAADNTPQTNVKQIEKTHWLIGKWENKTPDGESAEVWRKVNDSTLSAVSYFVAENDTITNEKIRIEQRNGQLAYIAWAKKQNNNQEVRFVLTSASDNQMVFENPEHDYPQKITYTLVNSDSLYAEISGTKKGRFSKIPFPMTRAKKS